MRICRAITTNYDTGCKRKEMQMDTMFIVINSFRINPYLYYFFWTEN